MKWTTFNQNSARYLLKGAGRGMAISVATRCPGGTDISEWDAGAVVGWWGVNRGLVWKGGGGAGGWVHREGAHSPSNGQGIC